MVRPRWAAFAILAAVALAACGGGGGSESAVGRTGDPATRVAAGFEDLARLLDIAVPEGYALQPDEVGDTGPSDLEKAIRDDGAADARDVLTRTGYLRGFQRLWRQPAGDEIISYVYQFADHAGAVEYTGRVTGTSGGSGPAVTTFSVPRIDGAVGVNGSDTGYATSTVTFVKGPYSVHLVANSSSPAGLQTLATALAEEQYSRL